MTPMIKVNNLHKKFGDVEVLKGIDFEVNKGDVIAVIGSSGSGKSTLLRCLIDLETADVGDIVIEGQYLMKDGTYESPTEVRKIIGKMGMVFQHFNLFPHLSVRDNLELAPKMVKKSKEAELLERVQEQLKEVGLSEKIDCMPSTLSGGEKQRVAIARALMMDPDILLFDEPTSALDPELTGEVLNVIQKLANNKMTMMVVTHEMAFARRVANRILFMSDGIILEEGLPETIFENPQNDRTKEFLSNYMQD